MSDTLQLSLVFALIAALLGAMAGLRRFAENHGWPAEIQRKIVHISAGGLAICLPWVFADAWPVYLLLGLTLGAMIAMRLPVLSGLGKTLHGVNRKSYGDFLLVVSVGLVFLFSNGNAVLYVLPLAVLTLADAAAAIAGSTYGKHFFRTEDGHKSLEGSAVFFLVTLLVCILCFLMLTDIPRENVILLAAAIAVFTTVVEADSWHGFDNLFLPMGVLIFLSTTLDMPVWDAVTRLGLLFVAIAILAALTRRVGLSSHVARVYAIAFFMLLSVTALQNAVLPTLLLLAQAADRRAAGAARNLAALEIVGALALVSFGFLAAGIATGVNAINYYALAIAAMAASHAALGLERRAAWLRLTGAAVCAAALFAVWVAVTNTNPASTYWHPPINAFAIAILAISALVPSAIPRWFQQRRNSKAALLGVFPTVLLYFILLLREGIL
ncbi:hypothetical protein [Actibacterium lipolyticum]|uniref:Cytidylyltransferase family protein n=1 Tax=Actibacterium lipolyticum TaxID=1524263 RepID=A0A238KSQ5_9RHOB|nr:hypothetical protein [Actibacterium lipolyticum]SMX45690.1 Cytidylyltransferase family protein [Actibacterium lipolyticum]